MTDKNGRLGLHTQQQSQCNESKARYQKKLYTIGDFLPKNMTRLTEKAALKKC